MNQYNRVEKELNKFDTNLKEHKSYLIDYQKSMNLIKKCSKVNCVSIAINYPILVLKIKWNLRYLIIID